MFQRLEEVAGDGKLAEDTSTRLLFSFKAFLPPLINYSGGGFLKVVSGRTRGSSTIPLEELGVVSPVS